MTKVAAHCRHTGKILPLPSGARGNGAPGTSYPQSGTLIADLTPELCAERREMGDNSLFGVHGAALSVRSQRMGLLASNIANASTPGFKARDIDFHAALSAIETSGGNLDNAIDSATQYRVPLQPSQDGNTVELTTEQTAFAENAVAYQTTLAFLNGRIGQITRALKGE